MTEAGDLVRAIIAAGDTKAGLARTLGRNSSLITQLERGFKPAGGGRRTAISGATYVPALRERLAQLQAGAPGPVAEPPRRVTRAGTAARTRAAVRAPDVRDVGNGWSTARTARQATASGARRLVAELENAAALGRKVAISVTVRKEVNIRGSGGSAAVVHPPRKGVPASKEVRIGDSAAGGSPDWWLERVRAAGGSLTVAVARACVELGMTESLEPAQVLGLELSTWTV